MGEIDLAELADLQAGQDGVVTRVQLRSVGATKSDLDRMLRRRELTRRHPGVFLDHTGPPTWRQRAWAAILYAAPAALYLESAEDPPAEDPIHIAIDATRRIGRIEGVRIHRVRNLGPLVQWNRQPPRVRVEANTLERAHRAGSELEAIRVVTSAVGSRRTTAERLRATLDDRTRLHRRLLLKGVLDDLEHGACSVLEHGYLTRVERAHGLPTASRQRLRIGVRGSEYRDVDYEEFGLVVELDGRVAHEAWAAQGRDADRDLDDHADGRESVRVRWAQVYGTPCRTADRVGRILTRRGWSGTPTACSPGCEAA